ncbi:hypothetical protein [Nioella aestuarii]|uniref:hypothetical protein n=1 Tax=Nioella aestuarii TaxID=1662864 RepID=UPI003D7FA14D
MRPTLPVLLILLAAPALADSYSPTPGDIVTIGQGGLGLSAADATATATLPFGAPFHESLRTLATIMGHDFSVYLPEECPAGPVVVVSFPNQIDLIYQQDQLAGFMLRRGSTLTTQAGVGLGTPLAALGSFATLDVMESTLGWEFQAGQIHGLLSEREGIVEHLWSGTVCIFR